MSITNISETSAASLQDVANSETSRAAIASTLQIHGPHTAADVVALAHLDAVSQPYARFRELAKEGIIRKIGQRVRSSQTNQTGDVWAFVPEGPARRQAQLEYWQESLARHTKEYAKAVEVLATDNAMVSKYSQE